jgi:phosphoenolpyruvate carboxykinase (ATP)
VGDRCIRPTPEELENFGTPDFTIYNAGQFPCNRYTHYMTSSTSIDLNLARREMVILGSQYAGEMKKGLFSVMHYLMPKRQILSLHSGCNMGKDGDVALFFGLSGKVSSDRRLMRGHPLTTDMRPLTLALCISVYNVKCVILLLYNPLPFTNCSLSPFFPPLGKS